MKNYYIVKTSEGDIYTIDLDKIDAKHPFDFFRTVAHTLAMRDCTDEEVEKIVWQGKSYHYVGWRPGMEFTFVNDEDPEDFYTTWMEHLDH